MGIVYYTPEDAFFYYGLVERYGLIEDHTYHLNKYVANYEVSFSFPSGYIDYRLGYTNDPNNPYTYTFLQSSLYYNNYKSYYRRSKNSLYSTTNHPYLNPTPEYHTFTYNIEQSDDTYNYYKISTDQYVEIHDDDGQGGGGADWRYFESVDLLAVPKDASNTDVIGYINSYIVLGDFAAEVHGDYYYAKRTQTQGEQIASYDAVYYSSVLQDGTIVEREIEYHGVVIIPNFIYYSTKNIIQPNGNEDWYVHYKPAYLVYPDDDEYVSGHLEPTASVPGSVNEHNVLRNYYPMQNWTNDSAYPFAISSVIGNSDIPLTKTEYGYSSGGGFVQLLLADGYPDNKVHWQYRYMDIDGTMRWYTSVESFNVVHDNRKNIDYVEPINPLSATWYGPSNIHFDKITALDTQ